VAGFCEHGNEPLGSIKGGKFLKYLFYTHGMGENILMLVTFGSPFHHIITKKSHFWKKAYNGNFYF
jgi:hypothetical protein